MDGLYFSVVNQVNSCPSTVGDPYAIAADYLGITNALQTVANVLYNAFVDIAHYPFHAIMGFFADDVRAEKIDQIKYQFNEKLVSVQSAAAAPSSQKNIKPNDSFLGRADLLKVLRKIPVSDNQIRLIKKLESRKGNLDVEEWADVSTKLEVILADCRKDQRNEYSLGLEFIIKNIEHLEFKSRFAWAQLAHEAILDEVEQELSALWDQAYSDTTTVYGSAGVDVGLTKVATVGGRVSVGHTSKTFVDDEYNTVLLETVNVSVSVVAKLKDICGIVDVGAEGKKTTSVGSFKECSSAREFANQFFEMLIAKREYRSNPKIARYLSRRNTLNCSDFLMDLLTGDEILEVNALKQKNALEEKTGYMKDQLALFATADTPTRKEINEIQQSQWLQLDRDLLPEDKSTNPLNYTSTVVPEKNVISAAAQIDTWTASAKASAGFENCGVSISGAAQHEHMVLELMRFTPYCDRLTHQLKSSDEKAALTASIQTQVDGFKPKFIDKWKNDLIKVEIDEVNNQHLPLDKRPFKKTFVTEEHFTVNACLDYIEKEFNFFSKLHVRTTGAGDPHAQLMIDDFLKKYGVENKEQLLHNMIVFNAHLYTSATNPTDQQKALALEKTLLSAAFDVGQEYWKERAQVREQVDYEVSDKKVNFKVVGGYDGAVAAGASVKVELLVRERFHTNPLRSGHYIDVSLSPLGVNLSTDAQMLKKIAAQLQEEVALQFGDVFKHAVSVPGVAMTAEGDIVLRFFKPHCFPELGYAHLYTQYMLKTESKFDFEIPLWIAPCVDFVMGAGYSNAKTKCLYETYSNTTLLYFAMRFTHEWTVKKVKDNGEIAGDSYWRTIVRDQRVALEKLFARFNEKAGSLSAELNAFNDSIQANNLLSDTEKKNFKDARDELNDAMTSDDKNFEIRLKRFENLLHAFVPQFNEGKTNSRQIQEPAIFNGANWVAASDNRRTI